jgi:hypothetical protein
MFLVLYGVVFGYSAMIQTTTKNKKLTTTHKNKNTTPKTVKTNTKIFTTGP